MRKIEKIKNQFMLKRGLYSVILTVFVLVAVILLNVFATAIARNYPTDIDVSTAGQNSISDANIEYIEAVDKEVNVIVCAAEDQFASDYTVQYAQQFGVVFGNSGYAKQNQHFLELYSRYNDKIKVQYCDPDLPSFDAVQKLVPNQELTYGDILVYSTVKNEKGEDVINPRVVPFLEQYTIGQGTDSYGQSYYVIAGSNLETTLTSAIHGAITEERKTVALLAGHGKKGAFNAVVTSLQLNNYEFVEISDVVLKSIPEDVDILVLAAPEKDLAPDEVKVIEQFLENGGERGKNFMVFCDGAKTGYTNLYAFLAEWGAKLEEGSLVYETDEELQAATPFAPILINNETDYTKSINETAGAFVAGNVVPMRLAYQTNGSRTAQAIISTSDSAIMAPMGADKYWVPTSGTGKEQFAACIYTNDTVWKDSVAHVSGVFVCASYDFISEEWAAYGLPNVSAVIAVTNEISGRNNSEIFLDQRVLISNTFLPTESNTKTMRVIFVYALPLAIMATGIFVWVRRRRR